jgi:MFS family permease
VTTSPILRRSAAQGLLCGLVIVATSYGRTALAPVQEAMSSGLGLADMQVALIQGPAMAIPIVLSAAPFGLLVDRYSRARLMFALVAVSLAATWPAAGLMDTEIGSFRLPQLHVRSR